MKSIFMCMIKGINLVVIIFIANRLDNVIVALTERTSSSLISSWPDLTGLQTCDQVVPGSVPAGRTWRGSCKQFGSNVLLYKLNSAFITVSEVEVHGTFNTSK